MECEIKTKFLGPQSAMLEPLVENVPRIARDIMPDVSMALSGQSLCLTKQLKEVRLHTFFRPQTDTDEHVTIVPVFISPGAEMTLTWPVPKDMKLFFVARWGTDIREGTINAQFPLCYLVAKSEAKKTYLLPLPNLYEDGRVCMGEPQRDWIKANIFDTFTKALEIFHVAPWNADLMSSNDRWVASKLMFRFSPEGVAEPSARPWTELSTLTNNTNYQFVANL